LIFTGTPSGVGSIEIGDKLIGSLEGKEILKCEIK
jgi:2-keto-4-pentenoate hydratase/2-oxohepta-3-ene-1,7-dioic acid hydratase in catechol pathway